MPTFVMLSSAASESGDNKFNPNPYQFFFLEELLGNSPGCEFDKYSQDFNNALWYAFTEITEGDYSLIRKVDLNPESWYSPESVINLDAEIIVSGYLKEQESEWFTAMVNVRGEPRKYGTDYIFSCPRQNAEEIENPCDYEISQFAFERVIDGIEEKTRQAMIDFLYKEIVPVSELKEDEYGEYWGKVGDILVQLHFKSDDESEYQLAGNFKPTDIFVDGERLYIEL